MKTASMTMLEIGNFEDLEHLVGLLNGAFEGVEYRLEPLKGQKGSYLFVEDVLAEDDFICGLVEKKGRKAYAYSSDVHALILGAYQRYVEKTGKSY